MKIPQSIKFANLPTKIEKLERLSKRLNKNIYIKRDDQTGTEISGNKIRKLEFAVKEAIDQNANYLITCGGIQSNHARATATVAAKLGLGCHLVLRGNNDSELEGNYFLGKLLGANVQFITEDEYKDHRNEIMKDIQSKLEKEGHRAYIIPEGASNGIGSFGYYMAMEEILKQEEEIGVKFDAIVVTVGSGGTYTGLYYGNSINNNPATIYGINVAANSKYFKNAVINLLEEMGRYTNRKVFAEKDDIKIIDGYVGLGYALSQIEEIEFIKSLAQLEGIILDPVYTGKAMYGLVQEIQKGRFNEHNNILFIHTGGLFGWNRQQMRLVK